MANNENAKKENLTIEEMEAKLKAIDEQRSYYYECLKQKKAAEDKRKQEELKLAQTTRKKDVDSAIQIADKLLHEYIRDYGTYCADNDDATPLFWKSFGWF